MSLTADRLSAIRHAYFVDHDGAPQALALFMATRQKRGRRPNLTHLLRHHTESPAISDAETWKRDHFDFLLAYFSMVEVGCLANFLSAGLTKDYDDTAREVLNDPDVRRYYEDHYPIFLPQAHRLRVTKRGLVCDPGIAARGPQLFEQFFTLSQPIETGGPVETFLWFLDAGWRDGVEIDKTITALSDPKRFLKHASARPEDSKTGLLDPLSASVQGFLAYVDFAPRLLRLLRSASEYPLLQSAMWHFHGYWLGQMNLQMGWEVRRALKAIGSWEGSRATRGRSPVARQVTAQLTRAGQARALAYLSSGRFRFPLAEQLLAVAGSPRVGKFKSGAFDLDLAVSAGTESTAVVMTPEVPSSS